MVSIYLMGSNTESDTFLKGPNGKNMHFANKVEAQKYFDEYLSDLWCACEIE